ncbi:MAG: hypothetical protein MR051_08660 [Lentisphaeria bacterium]|nr:hypothetical protein [Lentisphaeria bacterium]
MRMKSLPALALATLLCGGGCAGSAVDTDAAAQHNTLPPAADHPAEAARQVKTAPSPQVPPPAEKAPAKVPAPAEVKPQSRPQAAPAVPEKKPSSAGARPPVPPPAGTPAPAVETSRRSPDGYRWMWHAFSRLSPQEQQSLMKIQRQDPEKFRTLMREKAEQLYAKREAWNRELDKLAQQYRDTGDHSEKARIKAELRNRLQADFQQRLQDSRRDLDANRRRLERMEAELRRRETNRDAIVDAVLADRLAGRKPAQPPKR